MVEIDQFRKEYKTMKEYAFSFSNEMKSNGEEYNLLLTTAYGIYNSEKEAILDAMKMCEYYGYEFTHLLVGQAEYFVIWQGTLKSVLARMVWR